MQVFGILFFACNFAFGNCKHSKHVMGVHQKKEGKKEKTVFASENSAFISRYELVSQKQTTKTKIMAELKLTRSQYENLEKQYLKLFYGKQ